MITALVTKALTKPRNRPIVLGFSTIICAFVGTISAAWFGGYRINLTPSKPLGIWRIIKLDRAPAVGDVVFICPLATAAMLEARARGYLHAGLCPSGVAPLIKTVVALAGQRVDVKVSVEVNGKPLPSSIVEQRDGQGRPMTRFAGGVVPPDHVFLFSPVAGSFDSRYFGPLPESAILGRAQEVLTYAP